MHAERRETLIDRLKNAFQDEAVRTKYREESSAKLAKDATRVFDGFQCLVSDTVLEQLCDQFRSIIAATNRVRNTSNGPVITQSEPKESIHRLQKTIAKIACFELFDQKHKIKPALINLLGWTGLENKIDNYDLVCAFVNEINLTIFQKLAAFITSHEQAFNAHCQLINQQYPFWSSEVLEAMAIPYDRARVKPVTVPAAPSDSDEEPDHRNRDLALGLGLGFTGTFIFGAAIAGFILFGRPPSPEREIANPAPSGTPPKSPRQ